MKELKEYIESKTDEIGKYETLKWIFDKKSFRYKDELLAFKKKLSDNMDYDQLDVFNTLMELMKKNVLENVAALDCVKIIIEK